MQRREKSALFSLMALCLGLSVGSAMADTTEWMSLKKAPSYAASMRALGKNGVVTGIKCGIKGNIPMLKFTYRLVDRPIKYNYAWSTEGEKAYKEGKRKFFSSKVQVVECHYKYFYYGVQNID
jgi:hypothetical protein